MRNSIFNRTITTVIQGRVVNILESLQYLSETSTFQQQQKEQEELMTELYTHIHTLKS
jgi:hypothetical protein